MSWILHRIDDRLIHGQVLVAWGGRLNPQRIWLVDDAVAANEWERQIYLDAAPGIDVRVVNVAEAAAAHAAEAAAPGTAFLLVRDLATALRLVEAGADVRAFNVGGLHYAPGRTKLNEFVYLDDADRAVARALLARGVALEAQDVPASRPQALATLEPALAPVTVQLLLTLLLGGLATLDATPVAQTLLSQPLVTSTLLGLLWGDPHTALSVGVVLQILAASTTPLGSRTPEDYATGGVAGAGVALALAHGVQLQPWRDAAEVVGVFVGMLTAMSGVPLIKWQRRRNEGLSRWCEGELRAGNEQALGQASLAGLSMAFAVGVALCAVWIAGGLVLLHPFVEHESLRLSRAWTLAQPLWMGFGLAQLLHAFMQRRLTRAGVFGAAMVGAWLTLVMGTP